jgi:glycosyltransferase involved in cell wall biosynthesis
VRVAIDARTAVSRERTGIGRYTRHLVRLLPRVDPATTYLAWYPSARAALRLGGRRRSFEDDAAPNLVDRAVPFPAPWFERLVKHQIPRLEWMVRFDVLFAPNFIPPPTRARGLVVTVHDLAFRLFPETAPVATRRWLTPLERALRQASRVIVVSENTRQDLLETYPVRPDRVTVVPPGVDGHVFRPATGTAVRNVRQRFGIEGPYLLTLGGIESRKNLPAVVQAYASLHSDVRPALVLAGPVAPWNPEGWERLRPALDGLPPTIRERIVVTGYVSETDTAALLSGATGLVYVSLYEGFGLPVIEAMACGTPVLTSNVSALPATAGGAALLVDPGDVDAIAAGIERLLTDVPLRESLRAAGITRSKAFSWWQTAVRTAEVIHHARE